MDRPEWLDDGWTVNEIVARFPETIAVFNRFGIDACCGGGTSVTKAAARDGADVNGLLDALRIAMREPVMP